MNPSNMMNSPGSWMDGGIVIWTVVGVVIIVLLFLVFKWCTRK